MYCSFQNLRSSTNPIPGIVCGQKYIVDVDDDAGFQSWQYFQELCVTPDFQHVTAVDKENVILFQALEL